MSVIKINSMDNVVVAVRPIMAGEVVVSEASACVKAACDIPFGHKIACKGIPKGSPVIKYGYAIGCATADIAAGEHVHSHNLKTALGEQLDYSYEPELVAAPEPRGDHFMGFRRSDGKVGIRNEIWIIPTVGCVNSIGAAVAQKARDFIAATGSGSISGVYSFSHPYGCSQLGQDHENTKKVLCALARHPNAGGVLILGLGCENNSVDEMKEMLGDYDKSRIRFVVCQEHENEISAALLSVEELIQIAAGDERETVSVSELTVGLKCGGSDGLSGISANPLVGAFTNSLTAEGGSAILTEVPEMFGAETILMSRCKNESVFQKTVALINNFKAYFRAHKQPIYENPSPGNKAGGITTLEDKALGCTQKAGSATVVDVLSYGEALSEKGLNLLEAPGNDLVASTALAASGAQLVLFTTGRGTPFGSPVPTVKISSNTPLAQKKSGWIDFDAGVLVSEIENVSMEGLSQTFHEYVLRLASGEELTKTEQNGIRDMAIFKTGVTL